MVDNCGIFLKKQWFITSKPGKLEHSYVFDPKKVFNNKIFKKTWISLKK